MFRPNNKILPFRVADTGMDPHKNLEHFIKNDVIKNIDVHQNNQDQQQ